MMFAAGQIGHRDLEPLGDGEETPAASDYFPAASNCWLDLPHPGAPAEASDPGNPFHVVTDESESCPAVYVCDVDGHIACFNSQAVTLWGSKPDGGWNYLPCETADPPASDGGSEQGLITGAVNCGRCLRNQKANILRADGSMLPVSVSTDPLYDREGKVLGAVFVLRARSNRPRPRHQRRVSDRIGP